MIACQLGLGCASFRPDPATVDGAFKLIHPSTRELETIIADKGVRTLINFRGFEPDSNWYREQVRLCRSKNVRFVDATIDLNGPDREEIATLLEIFHGDGKPIALCDDWGGERAGFAMGLYRLAVLKEDREVARRELPLWHSQNAPVSRFRELDRFLADWRDEREFYATYQLPEAQSRARSKPKDAVKAEKDAVRTVDRKWPLGLEKLVGARSVEPPLENPPVHRLWNDIPERAELATKINRQGAPYDETRMAQRRMRKSTALSELMSDTWRKLTDARGVDQVWTEGGGLEESQTVRDYRGLIVDKPISAGPRLWGKSPRRNIPSREDDFSSLRKVDRARVDEAVMPVRWSAEQPDDELPAKNPRRPARAAVLGTPLP